MTSASLVQCRYRLPRTRADEDAVIRKALAILRGRLMRRGAAIESVAAVVDYVRLSLGGAMAEEFMVLYLDNRHRLIGSETLFRGTVDGCEVHPRVVAQRALEVNAAAVLFAHNHPSGEPTPSGADLYFTDALMDALDLFDIRVLDHVVVGGLRHCSMAGQGKLTDEARAERRAMLHA